MRAVTPLAAISICLVPLGIAADAGHPSVFAQLEAPRSPAPTGPNALDAQDRLRDAARDRAHQDVKGRLGDTSPEPPANRGFAAPSTDYKPDVPDARPVPPNQTR